MDWIIWPPQWPWNCVAGIACFVILVCVGITLGRTPRPSPKVSVEPDRADGTPSAAGVGVDLTPEIVTHAMTAQLRAKRLRRRHRRKQQRLSRRGGTPSPGRSG